MLRYWIWKQKLVKKVLSNGVIKGMTQMSKKVKGSILMFIIWMVSISAKYKNSKMGLGKVSSKWTRLINRSKKQKTKTLNKNKSKERKKRSKKRNRRKHRGSKTHNSRTQLVKSKRRCMIESKLYSSRKKTKRLNKLLNSLIIKRTKTKTKIKSHKSKNINNSKTKTKGKTRGRKQKRKIKRNYQLISNKNNQLKR